MLAATLRDAHQHLSIAGFARRSEKRTSEDRIALCLHELGKKCGITMVCVTREMGFAREVAICVISMDKEGFRRGDGGRIFRQFEAPEIEAVPVGSASLGAWLVLAR